MLNEELRDGLINQMNAEFESYYLYLSMAGYFDTESWPGFAKWMYLQAEEEREHAMKIYEHLIRRGENPKLLQISAPKNDWENSLEAFTDAFNHEQKITQMIHELMGKAVEVKDYGAKLLLDWFVDEQIEEEDTVGEILDRVKRIDGDNQGLMLIDAELGEREEVAL